MLSQNVLDALKQPNDLVHVSQPAHRSPIEPQRLVSAIFHPRTTPHLPWSLRNNYGLSLLTKTIAGYLKSFLITGVAAFDTSVTRLCGTILIQP